MRYSLPQLTTNHLEIITDYCVANKVDFFDKSAELMVAAMLKAKGKKTYVDLFTDQCIMSNCQDIHVVRNNKLTWDIKGFPEGSFVALVKMREEDSYCYIVKSEKLKKGTYTEKQINEMKP